jgi:uncharacterized membrane protein
MRGIGLSIINTIILFGIVLFIIVIVFFVIEKLSQSGKGKEPNCNDNDYGYRGWRRWL